jgi:hypothetical protein
MRQRRQQRCAPMQAKQGVLAPRRNQLRVLTTCCTRWRDFPLPKAGEGAISPHNQVESEECRLKVFPAFNILGIRRILRNNRHAASSTDGT